MAIDWYDNEHGPRRLTVPGVLGGSRWKRTDTQNPSWLAMFDITVPDVARGPGYLSIHAHLTPKDIEIMPRLQTYTHQVYQLVGSCVKPDTPPHLLPASYIFVVHTEVTDEMEQEFNRWYDEEHMPMVCAMEGWIRGRRYKLVESTHHASGGQPPPDLSHRYLAIHELEREGFAGLVGFKESSDTPWRQEMMSGVINRQLRLFEQHVVFAR